MGFDGSKLKTLRIRAGFKTLRKFAEALRACGVSTTASAVMLWERGSSTPSADYLFLIADVLGVSADDLRFDDPIAR